MNDYDIAVIGAGPGGYIAALKAAELGARVAVIEAKQWGGHGPDDGRRQSPGFGAHDFPASDPWRSPQGGGGGRAWLCAACAGAQVRAQNGGFDTMSGRGKGDRTCWNG